MKNAVIVALLLITSGAFIGMIVDEGFNLSTASAGDEHAQLMWGAIDVVVVIVCLFHARQLVRIAAHQPAILAFVGWVTLSLAWSENPALTARRIVGLLCTTAMGFLLGMRLDLRTMMRLLAWAMAIAMIASLVAVVLFPSFGITPKLDGGAWRGVFSHKNQFGLTMGIALLVFCCLLWESREDRTINLGFLCLAICLLAASRSLTSLIVTSLTLCVGLWRRLRLHPAQRVALLATSLLVGLGAAFFLEGRTDAVLALLGRDSTLTGRVPLWQLSADLIFRRPLLGSGWDAFWLGSGGDYIRSLVHWDVPHAHNAFLEISLNIGLIGLAIFSILNLDCLLRAIRYSRSAVHPFRLWPLLFYCYTFFFYFTESPPVDRHTLMFVMFCALSVSLTEAARAEAAGHRAAEEEEFLSSGVLSDSGMAQEFQ